MSEKRYLIIPRNTGQMLLVDKLLRDNRIAAEVVPAPPRPGLICTRAIKIGERDLNTVSKLFDQNKIQVSEILEEEELKLQHLIDQKLKPAAS